MMPDSNAAALSRHDAEQTRRQEFLPTFGEALDDLIDRILSGESYPPHARIKISLFNLLCEQVDAGELAEYLCAFMCGNEDSQDRARKNVESIVRDFLHGEGHLWVERRMEDMADEREEETK